MTIVSCKKVTWTSDDIHERPPSSNEHENVRQVFVCSAAGCGFISHGIRLWFHHVIIQLDWFSSIFWKNILIGLNFVAPQRGQWGVSLGKKPMNPAIIEIELAKFWELPLGCSPTLDIWLLSYARDAILLIAGRDAGRRRLVHKRMGRCQEAPSCMCWTDRNKNCIYIYIRICTHTINTLYIYIFQKTKPMNWY